MKKTTKQMDKHTIDSESASRVVELMRKALDGYEQAKEEAMRLIAEAIKSTPDKQLVLDDQDFWLYEDCDWVSRIYLKGDTLRVKIDGWYQQRSKYANMKNRDDIDVNELCDILLLTYKDYLK